jgi:hypothetical protein
MLPFFLDLAREWRAAADRLRSGGLAERDPCWACGARPRGAT